MFFNGDKVALYHQASETEDLTYGTATVSYTTYSLPMNGNILSFMDKMVRQGMTVAGEAVGVLRYEYTEDAAGTAITPTLIPKIHDEFTFMQRRYRIDDLTPQMNEDHQIILYTFKASPVNTEGDLTFPYQFPIQF